MAKHEFGHILGLGDMYEDDKNFWFLNLSGIKYPVESNGSILPKIDGIKKYFPDLLDAYQTNGVPNKDPDSVMYWNGTIHNNDIEMVIEAFHTGKRQNFQIQGLFGDEISTVLGKGN